MGRFLKALYGTRDALAVWQRLVRRVMSELGFCASKTAACVYVHRPRGLRVVAHVDDFLVTGPKAELIELRQQFQKDYEVDGEILGGEPDEKHECKFLGKKIIHQAWGIELEADGRLVQRPLDEYGSEGPSIETPGLKDEKEPSDTPMTAAEASLSL